MIRHGFSPPSEISDTDSVDEANTEIITRNNGRGVIIDEWEKLEAVTSRGERNNEMQFGINNCTILVVHGEVLRFLNNSNPTFYLSSQVLLKTNCYIYLGVPFSNDLELKQII